MSKDFLKDVKPRYDVIVIGSGLAGLTGANVLAKQGYSVLLLEHHYQLGGMATWFKRKGGHIFDISLHGFPVGISRVAASIGLPKSPKASYSLREFASRTRSSHSERHSIARTSPASSRSSSGSLKRWWTSSSRPPAR
jgi:phytoene dehydrogenase-like protein